MTSVTNLWLQWVEQTNIPRGTNAWKTYKHENNIFLTEEQCECTTRRWNHAYVNNNAWFTYLNSFTD